MQRRAVRSLSLLFVFASIVLLACDIGSLTRGKPTVILASPPHGSQFREGEDVAFQSNATDSSGVTRVELVVDGAVVRTDSPPGQQPQPSLTLIQTWKATQGTHAISVRAYNASSAVSDPASISITVNAAPTPTTVPTVPPTAPPPTPVPTTPPTTVPTPVGCTNNSAFVADVTVPDGTTLALNQTFNKIWRVRNSGTCTWEAGYQLVFASGAAMTGTTAIAVPLTAPGATADLLVAMTAPGTTGAHSGVWRLKASNGTIFGTSVTVKINVIDPNQPQQPPSEQVTPPPPNQSGNCSGAPTISSFTTNYSTILKGSTATLSWGEVSNADSVDIDQGVGGVGTPGSATVSPASDTTYTMTAHCGSNTTTKQVTIKVSFILIKPGITLVVPLLKPDLYVTAFSVSPNPPHKGAVVHVSISVYNGGSVNAGAFKVRWLAGTTFATPPPCTWSLAGLVAHGGQVLTCDPVSPYNSPYGSITTRAQVDYEGSVNESDEDNNNKDMTYQVLP